MVTLVRHVHTAMGLLVVIAISSAHVVYQIQPRLSTIAERLCADIADESREQGDVLPMRLAERCQSAGPEGLRIGDLREAIGALLFGRNANDVDESYLALIADRALAKRCPGIGIRPGVEVPREARDRCLRALGATGKEEIDFSVARAKYLLIEMAGDLQRVQRMLVGQELEDLLSVSEAGPSIEPEVGVSVFGVDVAVEPMRAQSVLALLMIAIYLYTLSTIKEIRVSATAAAPKHSDWMFFYRSREGPLAGAMWLLSPAALAVVAALFAMRNIVEEGLGLVDVLTLLAIIASLVIAWLCTAEAMRARTSFLETHRVDGAPSKADAAVSDESVPVPASPAAQAPTAADAPRRSAVFARPRDRNRRKTGSSD